MGNRELKGTEESKSYVKVKIEFAIALDDCVPESLNKVGLMFIQHGQALVLANDSNKDTVEENGESCLPFY